MASHEESPISPRPAFLGFVYCPSYLMNDEFSLIMLLLYVASLKVVLFAPKINLSRSDSAFPFEE